MSKGKKKGYAPGLGEFTYSEEYVDLNKEVHLDKFAKNPRMSQGVNGLKRLKDLDQLLKEKSNTI